MPTFQIIFQGKVLDGHKPDEVKRNIAAIFGRDVKQIENLFSGKSVIIKKDIDEATALKYQAIFKKAGAVCELKSSPQAVDQSKPASVIVPKPQRAARDIINKTFSNDFSGLTLAEPGVILGQPQQPPEVQIEDFSSLSLAEPGTLLSEPKEITYPEIEDFGGLTLEKTDSFTRTAIE